MKKKTGFTLTELLVVVVIIGVLSAVVLPKFNKMLEARKTTEAENIMTAVRSEQEARCSLDKEYATTTADLRSWPANGSKNFEFSVTRSGITATNSSAGYKLEMPSYRDGRICCSDGCDTLNKNYLACNELVAKADYKPADSQCTPAALDDMEDPTAHTETEPVLPPLPGCTVPSPSTQSKDCGCTGSGSTSRVFDTGLCQWGPWSECSEKETDCGTECNVPSETTQMDICGCTSNGTKTRTFDEGACKWGEWSACTEKETDCEPEAEKKKYLTNAVGCARYHGVFTEGGSGEFAGYASGWVSACSGRSIANCYAVHEGVRASYPGARPVPAGCRPGEECEACKVGDLYFANGQGNVWCVGSDGGSANDTRPQGRYSCASVNIYSCEERTTPPSQGVNCSPNSFGPGSGLQPNQPMTPSEF